MQLDMKDKYILITSGPTRAAIDAVRYLSNRSSGRLGARIAEEALSRGARVTLVAGPGSARPAPAQDCEARLRIIDIETVGDLMNVMQDELGGSAGGYDAIVHAMAVLDYEPECGPMEEKVSSDRATWELRLKRTPKVIANLKTWSPDGLLVAFKLLYGVSDEELIAAAAALMERNRADLVIANDLKRIEGESHPALLIAPGGNVLGRPRTKAGIATLLCDIVAGPGTAGRF